MANLLPIVEAAQVLGEKLGTVRRWTKEGMPHHPGKRGRGNQTMVDPSVVREWTKLPTDDKRLAALADELPRRMAGAVMQCWDQATVLNRRREAGIYVAIWYQVAATSLDYLRTMNRDVPDVETYPDEIQRLIKIARGD